MVTENNATVIIPPLDVHAIVWIWVCISLSFLQRKVFWDRRSWWCLMTGSETSRGKFLPGKKAEEACPSATGVIFHFRRCLMFHSVYSMFSKHTHKLQGIIIFLEISQDSWWEFCTVVYQVHLHDLEVH